jgi:hypothetical protein
VAAVTFDRASWPYDPWSYDDLFEDLIEGNATEDSAAPIDYELVRTPGCPTPRDKWWDPKIRAYRPTGCKRNTC